MAIKADLMDAFDSGIVTIEVCVSVERLDTVDVIVMAAGATISRSIRKRSELAGKNIDLFQDVAFRLSWRCPGAFVVVISNPIELAVKVFCRHFARSRVLGMGAQQDSLRFARAIATHLNLPRAAVRASVLGEHGEGMVPLWSSVCVVDAQEEIAARLEALQRQYSTDASWALDSRLHEHIESMIETAQVEKAYLLLQTMSPSVKILLEPLITARVLCSTPNATANATLDCIAALRHADDRKVHGQVLLKGEFYGLHGVVGVPLALRQSEWRVGSYEPLTSEEVSRLEVVSGKINDLYASTLELAAT
jgi:malate dehydrogenase